MYYLLYVYKSFSTTPDNLIKAWEKHQKMKELEKLENKLNDVGALNMK